MCGNGTRGDRWGTIDLARADCGRGPFRHGKERDLTKAIVRGLRRLFKEAYADSHSLKTSVLKADGVEQRWRRNSDLRVSC